VENNSGFTLLLSYVVCIRFSVFAECFGIFVVLDDFCGFLYTLVSPSIEREILLDTLENDFGVVGDAQKWLAWPLIYLIESKDF